MGDKRAGKTPDPATVEVGDRLYRWWDAGGGKTFGAEQQELNVVRVNRLTYTVTTDQGSQFRIPHADIAGYVDWEDE